MTHSIQWTPKSFDGHPKPEQPAYRIADAMYDDATNEEADEDSVKHPAGIV